MDLSKKEINNRIQCLDRLININHAMINRRQPYHRVLNQVVRKTEEKFHVRNQQKKQEIKMRDVSQKRQIKRLYQILKETIDQQNCFEIELNQLRSNLESNLKYQTFLQTKSRSQSNNINKNYHTESSIENGLDLLKTIHPNQIRLATHHQNSQNHNLQFKETRNQIKLSNKYGKSQVQQKTASKQHILICDDSYSLQTNVKNSSKKRLRNKSEVSCKENNNNKLATTIKQIKEKRFKSLKNIKNKPILGTMFTRSHQKFTKSINIQQTKSIPSVDYKMLVVQKIRNKIIESDQIFKDSHFKTSKHQHCHIFNTFNLQKKLRDDMIKRVYDLQDSKSYK